MHQTDDTCAQGESLRAEFERLTAQVAQLRSLAKEAQDHEQLLCDIIRYLVPGSSLNAMLSHVLSRILEFTQADAGSIVLLNDQGKIVSQVSQLAGSAQDESRPYQALQQTLNSGLTEWVIGHTQPALVADTTIDERWTRVPGGSSEVRSALAIPLCYNDRVHGLLCMSSHTPNHLQERHLVALSSVTDQIATAIENRRFVHSESSSSR